MKKYTLLKITSFILVALMLFNMSGFTAFAVKSPFDSEDSLRKKTIASVSGKSNKMFTRNNQYFGIEENGYERYVVCFKENVSLSKIKNALKDYKYRLLADSDQRIFLIYLDEDGKTFKSNHEDIILSMEKDTKKQLSSFIPNDPYGSVFELELLEMNYAWDYGFGNEKIIIAIADSGVDRNHEDLSGASILPGYDFEKGESFVYDDATGHGTKVTGIISARNNNGIGCAGIAPNCSVLPLKITNSEGKIYTSDFIDALYLAADSGANIINMSFGSYEKLESEEKAVKYAISKGCILVAAAGNEGNHAEYSGMKCYPASYDGVLSVGAVDESGKSCIFSQHNDSVDIAAPGSGLSLLQSGGGYTQDSGTSFSTAFVSGVAALALSLLDEGIKMNSDQFDYLISSYATGDSDNKLGAGLLCPKEILTHANFPLVSGVENGKVYYDNISIYFNRGIATLDGELFESGALCKHTGEHVLIVEDGENSTVVRFTTDNLPLTCSLKEGEGFSYITFPYGTAKLNGHPYFSGDKITADGKHTLTLTGLHGNEKTFEYALSFSPPQINGVKNGEVYNCPKRINIASGGKIYLDGKETKKEFTVYEEGHHTILIKQNGNLKTSISFTISYEDSENPYKYQIFDSSLSNSLTAMGNGMIAVYNTINRGIRIFDRKTSKLIRYINLGENVKSVYFSGKILYIAGTNRLFAIDTEKTMSSSELLTIHKFEFPLQAATFEGNALYFAESSSITSGTIKKLDFNLTTVINETAICFIRDIPNYISYDKTTDCVAFAKTEELNLYISPVSGESIKMFTPFESLENGFIFKDGKIACRGNVFDIENEKIIFNVSDNASLWFDGKTLITENAIYDISSFENTGIHGFTFTSLCFDGEYYCASFGDVSLYVSQRLPSAENKGVAHSHGNGFGFSDHVYLSKDFKNTVFVQNNLYAINGSNEVYVFNSNLEYQNHFYVSFVPDNIGTDGDNIYIHSSKTNYFAVYNTQNNNISYFDAPCKISELSASKEYISFIGDGALYVYKADGTPIIEDQTSKYISVSMSHDGKNLYAIHTRSFYNLLTSYTLPDFDIEYNRILEYDADNIFCDSTYLYINTAAYLTRNGSISASSSAKIYGRTFNTFITSKGLFAHEEFLSQRNYTATAFALNENNDLYLFNEEMVHIEKNIYEGDLGASPEVQGIKDGESYEGHVTISFSKGMGYLDGFKIESGAKITQGGEHILTIILPHGLTSEYRFSLKASLGDIRIIGGNRAIKINDTISLEVEFLPSGAPAEEIMFYAETDVLTVTTDGTVSGLKAGTANVFAATMDGRFFTSIQISVLASMLDFTPSFLSIDRTNNILCGVPSGTTVDSLLKFVDPSIKNNVTIHHGEDLANGLVKTGMVITLNSQSREIQDELQISVIGDCNGDGDVDVGDLAEASILMNKPDAKTVFIKSADFSNTGTIDAADLFTYKEIILGNEKTIQRANSKKTEYTKDLLWEYTSEEDGTISLFIFAKENLVKGFSGTLTFDTNDLDFISSNNIGYINDVEDKNGTVNFVSIVENSNLDSEKTNLLQLMFLRKTQKPIKISAKDIIIYTASDEKAESQFVKDKEIILSSGEKNEQDGISILLPSAGEIIPNFSPEIYSYVLRVPFGTKNVYFESEGKPLKIEGNENISDGSIITVSFGKNHYKITVLIENQTVSHKGTPLWLVILIIILCITILPLIVILIFFGKNIKNILSVMIRQKDKR